MKNNTITLIARDTEWANDDSGVGCEDPKSGTTDRLA